MNAPEKLTWNQQKELIRFLIDGSGKLQPTSDVEADFTTDLIFLILRFCQDETNFKKDIDQQGAKVAPSRHLNQTHFTRRAIAVTVLLLICISHPEV